MKPPVQKKVMNFPEAVKALLIGRKITKLEWKNKETYGIIMGNLKLHKDGKFFDWILNDGDLYGEDFTVID